MRQFVPFFRFYFSLCAVLPLLHLFFSLLYHIFAYFRSLIAFYFFLTCFQINAVCYSGCNVDWTPWGGHVARRGDVSVAIAGRLHGTVQYSRRQDIQVDVNLYKCVYVGPFFKYDFSLIENLYMCLLNTEIFLSPYEWVCSSWALLCIGRRKKGGKGLRYKLVRAGTSWVSNNKYYPLVSLFWLGLHWYMGHFVHLISFR